MRILVWLLFFGFIFPSCGGSDRQGLGNHQNAKNERLNSVDTTTQGTQTKNIEIDTADLDYIMGKFDPATHPDFSKIDLKHADREGLYMRQEGYADFVKMYEAALAEGVKLQIRSAARNFNYQKGIWERKWNGQTKIENGKDASVAYPDPLERARQILLYSSMPGTSRHHWGTDIDLNSFNNDWFSKGAGAKLYDWMQKHAHEYGFCQPYTDKENGRTGYEEEKWHWTYLPISKTLTHQSSEFLKNGMIEGFQGAEVATDVDMVRNFVLGIGLECLE